MSRASRSLLPLHWSLIAFVSAGCGLVDFDSEVSRTTDDVRALVQSRLNVEPPPRERLAEEATLREEVRRLLSEGLDEDRAARIALLHHSDVRAMYEELGIARAALIQAGLLRNPVLAADLRFFSGDPEVELSLTQSILDVFFRPLRRSLAEAELERAKAQVSQRLVSMVGEVRRALVEVRSESQLLRWERESLGAAEAARDLTRQLLDAGNVTDLEMAMREARVAGLKWSVASAENSIEEARERVNVLLGLWGDLVSWELSGEWGEALSLDSISGVDVSRVESRSVGASLELAENRARIDAAARHAGITEWERWVPELEAGLSAKRETGGEWGLGPAIAAALPVLDLGQAAQESARADLRRHLFHHAALAVEIRAAARTLRQRFLHLRDGARFHEDVYVPLKSKVAHETLLQYNAMQVGAFDVLAAKQEEIAAQLEHVRIVRGAWLAFLDLKQLLAGSLDRQRLKDVPEVSGHDMLEPADNEGGH